MLAEHEAHLKQQVYALADLSELILTPLEQRCR